MNSPNFVAVTETGEVGRRMHALVPRLYPLCRSITGDAFRQTLEHGLVLACVGSGRLHEVVGFSPYGYDGRQFRSPGVRHPGRLPEPDAARQFPEYHPEQ